MLNCSPEAQTYATHSLPHNTLLVLNALPETHTYGAHVYPPAGWCWSNFPFNTD